MARFEVDPERSQVWIEASSSLHPIHSTTTGLGGWVDLAFTRAGRVDVAKPASGRIDLPVDKLRSGNPLEDREMRRRIDARRYPLIVGEMTSIEKLDGGQRYRVAGDLTFRGVTLRYQDEMTVELVDPTTVVMAGEKEFDVRDFGMQPPRILMLRVHPEVNVRVRVTAVSR